MLQHFALFFEGRLSEELTRLSVPVYTLGAVRTSRPWSVWRARRRLTRLLSESRADVVISHGVWPIVVVGSAVHRLGLPLVLFQHTAVRPDDWFERRASRISPDALLANSTFTARTLKPLYPSQTPLVYRCPVPVPPVLTASEREALRCELGVAPDQVLIIQTSRLEPGKGQRAHLQALAELKGDPSWVSVQVGGPQRPEEHRYYAELKALAARLGILDRVKFLGERQDVPRLLAAADIHCQPSQHPEGFGLTFIEAMLAGLPVVTTKLGAVTEFISAETGILTTNHEELVAALARLIASPAERRAMGENGRRAAIRLCGPENQVPELFELLSSVKRNFTYTRERQ